MNAEVKLDMLTKLEAFLLPPVVRIQNCGHLLFLLLGYYVILKVVLVINQYELLRPEMLVYRCMKLTQRAGHYTQYTAVVI